MISRYSRLVLLGLAVLTTLIATAFLSGCGHAPQRKYYTLSYPLEQDTENLNRPTLYPASLRIKKFTIAVPYNRPQLVYRQSPFEFQYYGYRFWAAKPQEMVRDMMKEHLQSLHIFNTVELEYTDKPPEYELSAEVDAIEEYDSGNDWYAHLAMKIELSRFSDKKVLWRHSFDRKRPVYKKNPVYVIRTLSEILKTEMAVVAAGVDKAIATERGVSPTLVCPAVTDDAVPFFDESVRPEDEKTLKIERPPDDNRDLITPDGDAGQ